MRKGNPSAVLRPGFSGDSRFPLSPRILAGSNKSRAFGGHADKQFRDFSLNSRSSRVVAVFETIELAGDQLALPAQDSVRLRQRSNGFERPTSESLADFRQSGSLRISQRGSRRQVPPQDPVSAIRYSFWSRSWRFTMPVTYASERATSTSSK